MSEGPLRIGVFFPATDYFALPKMNEELGRIRAAVVSASKAALLHGRFTTPCHGTYEVARDGSVTAYDHGSRLAPGFDPGEPATLPIDSLEGDVAFAFASLPGSVLRGVRENFDYLALLSLRTQSMTDVGADLSVVDRRGNGSSLHTSAYFALLHHLAGQEGVVYDGRERWPAMEREMEDRLLLEPAAPRLPEAMRARVRDTYQGRFSLRPGRDAPVISREAV